MSARRRLSSIRTQLYAVRVLHGIRTQLYAVQLVTLIVSMSVGLISASEIRRVSTEQANQHAEVSFNQTVQSIESLLASLTETTSAFAYTNIAQRLLGTDGWPDGAREIYDSAMSNVRFIVNTNPNVVDIALVDRGGKNYLFGTQLDSVLIRYAMNYVTDLGERARYDSTFVSVLSDSAFNNRGSVVYVFPVYSSLPGGLAGTRIGTCLALCRTSLIVDIIGASLSGNNAFTLTDRDGAVLARQGRGMGEDAAGVGTDGADAGDPVSFNEHIFTGSLWRLRQIVYEDAAGLSRRVYLSAVAVFTLLAAIMILVSMLIVRRNISSPIVQINRQLQRISSMPDPDGRIEVSVRNELCTITENINNMLGQLALENRRNVENQKHILEVELSKNRLRLSALQSQINPHFLYNTLACIRGIALQNNLPIVADIASNMATLFRYSIKGDAFVSLREEIGITKKYLDIMNLRMDGRFNVNIDIPAELMDTRIVKMMLQPLVENAVFHGLEGKENGGRLDITAEYLDKERYRLSVTDDGAGIREDALAALNALLDSDAERGKAGAAYGEMGIGIVNISQKIKLLTGPAYGLNITSEYGRYTTVSVTMPILLTNPKTS